MTDTSDSPDSCLRALQAHFEQVKALHLCDLFAGDPERGNRLTAEGAGLYLDYSKNRLTGETLELLFDLAASVAWPTAETPCSRRTRQRLRGQGRASPGPAGAARRPHVVTAATSSLMSMRCSTRWRSSPTASARARGKANGQPVKTVVQHRIGGSYLGPEMAYLALRSCADRGIELRSVSKHRWGGSVEATRGLDPQKPCSWSPPRLSRPSKRWTNATSARRMAGGGSWRRGRGRPSFVAVSTNAAAVEGFGIEPSNMFGFWDWWAADTPWTRPSAFPR